MEYKNKKQQLKREDLEDIQKEVVDLCIKKIEHEKQGDIAKEQETMKEKDNQIKDIVSKVESLEREKRRNNLVLYNLKESDKDEAMQRYVEDENHIKKIFGQELQRDNFKIERIVRLGIKKDNLRRPTLVEMRSEREKIDILRNAKMMRYSTEYPKLYINKDLTVTERKRVKELRDQLRERRNGGEGEFIIKRGQVVEKPRVSPVDENNNTIYQNKTVLLPGEGEGEAVGVEQEERLWEIFSKGSGAGG